MMMALQIMTTAFINTQKQKEFRRIAQTRALYSVRMYCRLVTFMMKLRPDFEERLRVRNRHVLTYMGRLCTVHEEGAKETFLNFFRKTATITAVSVPMNTFIASVRKMHAAAQRSFARQRCRRKFLDEYYSLLISARAEKKMESGKVDSELDILLRLRSDIQLRNEIVQSFVSLRNMVFKYKRQASTLNYHGTASTDEYLQLNKNNKELLELIKKSAVDIGICGEGEELPYGYGDVPAHGDLMPYSLVPKKGELDAILDRQILVLRSMEED